jgi:hypothetical protein
LRSIKGAARTCQRHRFTWAKSAMLKRYGG